MAGPNATTPRFVEGLTPWLLIVMAVLAALGALLRTFFATSASLLDRLDHTTLLYLAVGGGLLMLREVRSLSFGGYKLEMLERVKERQAQQEDQIEDIKLMLPFLLPLHERAHLVNLAQGRTAGYKGNSAVKSELRRLRSFGLIAMRPDQHVGYIKDGATFDLAFYVELTELGKRWVRKIRQIEKSEAVLDEPAGALGDGA